MRDEAPAAAAPVGDEAQTAAHGEADAITRNASSGAAVSIGRSYPTWTDRVVEEGTPAPDFELTTDSGETVRLSDLRGKPVVLYFYPKDDTPGCTKQACGIRDAYDDFPNAA